MFKKGQNIKGYIVKDPNFQYKNGPIKIVLKCKDCGLYKVINKTQEDINNLERCYYREIDEKYYPKLRRAFWNMKDRCNNKENKSYKLYGGRGIKVKWKNVDHFVYDMYDSFIEHVRKHGVKNTSIDRVNVNGHYSKRNCRWATYQLQANNTRRTTIENRYIKPVKKVVAQCLNPMNRNRKLSRKIFLH